MAGGVACTHSDGAAAGRAPGVWGRRGVAADPCSLFTHLPTPPPSPNTTLMESPLTGDERATAAVPAAMTESARVRANAVYYGFAMLSVGFLVVLAFTMCVEG